MMNQPVNYHAGAFPPTHLDWERLIPLIGPAHAALARYDGVLAAIPNATVLLSPLTTQEAVLSSRIEGTQATMGDVLEYEAEGARASFSAARLADIREILNYRTALHTAVARLQELPLCQRVIREAHQVLLEGVRGQATAPGEYRRVPNWIGAPGCALAEARFIPIDAQRLPEAMTAWEKYLHATPPDRLTQLAILHAEFEALHPFLDGNGRLGRMLVPLFLCQTGLIRSPMFYISAYFDRHRDEYYHRLLQVSSAGDWTGWCAFFLSAVQSQAEENLRKATQILALHDEMKGKMIELTHSQYAIYARDWIFARPIFKRSDFVRAASIPKATALRMLNMLSAQGILKVLEPGQGRKSATLAFPALLNIAEGRIVF